MIRKECRNLTTVSVAFDKVVGERTFVALFRRFSLPLPITQLLHLSPQIADSI